MKRRRQNRKKARKQFKKTSGSKAINYLALRRRKGIIL